MRRLLVLAILCLIPAISRAAQSPKTLLWDQPQATAAEAQALTYKYYADGATTGVALTGVTCTGTTTVVCSVSFPAFTPGAHSIQITATNAAGEGAKSAAFSFTFVLVPAAPVNIRVQ